MDVRFAGQVLSTIVNLIIVLSYIVLSNYLPADLTGTGRNYG